VTPPTTAADEPYTTQFKSSNHRIAVIRFPVTSGTSARRHLLYFAALDRFHGCYRINARLARCDCDTLCHMAQRRSVASLPSYRAVPTRLRVDATRRSITAAAVHAFRMKGYSATTMSTIAALAQVSPRTLYRYYGNKSELFAATIAEATEDFLHRLSIDIHQTSLRAAVISAFEGAEFELNNESREMMRIASADEKVWHHFLAATTGMQPALAGILRAAAPESSVDSELAWDIRAGALLGAIATAYRQWATVAGSELSHLVAAAVDLVLPAISSASRGGYPDAPTSISVIAT
jgi:AcrR family transcriptional regulator